MAAINPEVNPEVTLDMAINSEETVASPPPDLHPVTAMEELSSVENDDNGHSSRRKWQTIKEMFQPEGRFRRMWNILFAVSCIMGVLLDPLFFYIPIANDDKKCIGMHREVMITAIILRTLADLPYVLHIYLILSAVGRNKLVLPKNDVVDQKRPLAARRIILFLQPSIIKSYIVDISAILPIPQALLFGSYSPSNPSKDMIKIQIAAFYIILQYLPRVVRVYQTTTERSKVTGQVWLQVIMFSIFQFVLASHVLGSFWYISSIQRLMSCWLQYSTCGGTENTTCTVGSLFCGSRTIRNISSVNDFCRTSDLKNSTLFDFGTFLDPLESGMLGSKNLPQKIIHCFWWGLKNLSSLGQSLDTTTDVYENFFAIFIFLAGMVLYVVSLSGNLQLGDKFNREEKVKRRMQIKDKEVDSWIMINDLPENMKEKIMKCVREKLEDNKDVDMENILSILPLGDRSEIDQFLRLASVKKVPEFQHMSTEILKEICEHLKPVTYPEACYIVREGEPLDMILFINQGLIRAIGVANTYKCLEQGEFYGKEVLNWALTKPISLSELPVSTEIVKSVTKVEAWALMANDLKNAVSNSMGTLPQNSPAT